MLSGLQTAQVNNGLAGAGLGNLAFGSTNGNNANTQTLGTNNLINQNTQVGDGDGSFGDIINKINKEGNTNNAGNSVNGLKQGLLDKNPYGGIPPTNTPVQFNQGGFGQIFPSSNANKFPESNFFGPQRYVKSIRLQSYIKKILLQ